MSDGYNDESVMASPTEADLQRVEQNAAAWRQRVESVAEFAYGDEKTARRVELLPEFHLMTEVNEILKRGAYPFFKYEPFARTNIVEVPDVDNYNKAEALSYYYNRSGDINDVSVVFSFLIDGFLKALILIIDDYPDDQDKRHGPIKDLLMRDFVDQIHRRTRNNVEAGLQFNMIEDPLLIGEEYTTSAAMEFLDRCYRRLEDIENGLSEYISFQGEGYFKPAAYPRVQNDQVSAALIGYAEITNQNLVDWFNQFHPEAAVSFDYMMNFMLDFREEYKKTKTPWGAGVDSEMYDANRMMFADTHINQTTDRLTEVRKQAQILMSLASCLTSAWNKLPNTRTLTCWVIFKEVVDGYMAFAVGDMQIPPMPNDLKPIYDPEFLDELFFGNNDALERLDDVKEAYNYVVEVMQVMSDEYDAGNETPMFNFKRNTWQGGQVEYSEQQIDPNGDPDKGFRMSMSEFYETITSLSEEQKQFMKRQINSLRTQE